MQTTMKRLYFIFFIICISVAGVAAQDQITVESQVDSAEILIGDVITYSVIVRHHPDVTVRMPEPAENLGMFEIRDFNIREPEIRDDEIVTRTDYDISTFDTGQFEIPELTVEYLLPEDSTARVLKTEPITINVKGLDVDEAASRKPNEAQLTPPRDWKQIVLIGIAALLALVAGIFLFRYLKSRKTGEPILPKKVEPPRPAHEVALEALNALTASNLLNQGEIKEYYIQLSDIIRDYIERRYYISAPEMTTTQVLREMKQQHLEKDSIEMMRTFLSSCDMVKFAKYIPSEAETEKSTALAFELVNTTKLVFAEPQEMDMEAEPADEESAPRREDGDV